VPCTHQLRLPLQVLPLRVRFQFVDDPAFHKLKAALENISKVEIIADPKYEKYSDPNQ
jgi:hypothetical protein